MCECSAANEASSALEQLEVALDAMFSMQAPFFGRYMLLSAVDRRSGGQGVVQFASIIHTPDRVWLAPACAFSLDTVLPSWAYV